MSPCDESALTVFSTTKIAFSPSYHSRLFISNQNFTIVQVAGLAEERFQMQREKGEPISNTNFTACYTIYASSLKSAVVFHILGASWVVGV